MNITVLSKENDPSAKKLCEKLKLNHNLFNPVPDVFINYGLRGQDKQDWDKSWGREFAKVPIINNFVQLSNYNMFKFVESFGIPIPESHLTVPKTLKAKDWDEYIVKKNWGGGSKIIKLSKKTIPMPDEYIQKYMNDWTLRLRTTISTWDRDCVGVWKKSKGNDTTFKWCGTEEAIFIKKVKLYSIALIKNLNNMSFCSFDFLYDKKTNVLKFVKLDACPKITEINAAYYFKMFSRLVEYLESCYEENSLNQLIKVLN